MRNYVAVAVYLAIQLIMFPFSIYKSVKLNGIFLVLDILLIFKNL